MKIEIQKSAQSRLGKCSTSDTLGSIMNPILSPPEAPAGTSRSHTSATRRCALVLSSFRVTESVGSGFVLRLVRIFFPPEYFDRRRGRASVLASPAGWWLRRRDGGPPVPECATFPSRPPNDAQSGTFEFQNVQHSRRARQNDAQSGNFPSQNVQPFRFLRSALRVPPSAFSMNLGSKAPFSSAGRRAILRLRHDRASHARCLRSEPANRTVVSLSRRALCRFAQAGRLVCGVGARGRAERPCGGGDFGNPGAGGSDLTPGGARFRGIGESRDTRGGHLRLERGAVSRPIFGQRPGDDAAQRWDRPGASPGARGDAEVSVDLKKRTETAQGVTTTNTTLNLQPLRSTPYANRNPRGAHRPGDLTTCAL